MSLLDHPLISRRYFFPRQDAVGDPFVVESRGVRLRCQRSPGDPMVVHFHGNGEVAADWGELPRALSEHRIGGSDHEQTRRLDRAEHDPTRMKHIDGSRFLRCGAIATIDPPRVPTIVSIDNEHTPTLEYFDW